MSKKYVAMLLTMAAVSVGVVAGCGGSDDSSSDAPTKAEFVTQADEVCQGASDALTEAQGELGADASEDDYVAFINDTYLPELQDESQALKDLTPPEGEEGAVDSIIAALDDGISAIESDPTTLLTSDAEGPLADATAQAKDFGLQVCGQS